MEGITYPLLSDFWPHGEVAQRYGVLRDSGDAERAIFIIDQHRVIRYIDVHDIDEQPDNEVLFAELGKLDTGIADSIRRYKEEAQEEEAQPDAEVVLYCTRWCPSCVKARKWFDRHRIEYVEVNVISNPKAGELVKEWGGGNRVTPTLNIRGTIIIGWEEEQVASLLLEEKK